jgi:hypothetical protein
MARTVAAETARREFCTSLPPRLRAGGLVARWLRLPQPWSVTRAGTRPPANSPRPTASSCVRCLAQIRTSASRASPPASRSSSWPRRLEPGQACASSTCAAARLDQPRASPAHSSARRSRWIGRRPRCTARMKMDGQTSIRSLARRRHSRLPVSRSTARSSWTASPRCTSPLAYSARSRECCGQAAVWWNDRTRSATVIARRLADRLAAAGPELKAELGDKAVDDLAATLAAWAELLECGRVAELAIMAVAKTRPP